VTRSHVCVSSLLLNLHSDYEFYCEDLTGSIGQICVSGLNRGQEETEIAALWSKLQFP
jgi:hypothetical protein